MFFLAMTSVSCAQKGADTMGTTNTMEAGMKSASDDKMKNSMDKPMDTMDEGTMDKSMDKNMRDTMK